MIAELYGKLENHMEDELTGNVFGTLRYAAFNKILKPILKSCVRPKNIAAVIEKINCDFFGQVRRAGFTFKLRRGDYLH